MVVFADLYNEQNILSYDRIDEMTSQIPNERCLEASLRFSLSA